ncbi:MAG: hypothetical protein JXA23_05510 [Bacteroidales bacterium]|nr:hypothetical protein [Bacteroidales bacterium]
MKPEFIELIGNARKRKGQKFRNQLYVFLMCLLVSIFLWILVKLSREYYYTIDYRINFTQIPPSYRLTYASDSVLTLNLRVQGYDFFTDRFLQRTTHSYDLDLSSVKVKAKGSVYSGYLLSNPIGYKISSQSRFQNYLLSTSPDTLYFEFERRKK